MIENNFNEAFEEMFLRECKANPSVKYDRPKYWDFYHRLWKSLPYIKALEAKMDDFEKLPISKRRYILQENDGHLERVNNPYYVQPKNEPKNEMNFCFHCGEKLQKHFTYCPKCGKKFK